MIYLIYIVLKLSLLFDIVLKLRLLLAADSSSSSSNVVVVCLSVVCDQVEKCLLTAK